MGISCIATDASATCMFKAKKDIIVILDVGHTDRDSGQISARGVKEYDLNMRLAQRVLDRKSTRLNSSHLGISYAVFCLKKKKIENLGLQVGCCGAYDGCIARGRRQERRVHDHEELVTLERRTQYAGDTSDEGGIDAYYE